MVQLHTVPIVIAVACAAILVPFLVFLKPSTPHDLNNFTVPVRATLGITIYIPQLDYCCIPFASVILNIVLFGVTRILNIGRSLNAMPLNSLFEMSPSGNILLLKILLPLIYISTQRCRSIPHSINVICIFSSSSFIWGG